MAQPRSTLRIVAADDPIPQPIGMFELIRTFTPPPIFRCRPSITVTNAN